MGYFANHLSSDCSAVLPYMSSVPSIVQSQLKYRPTRRYWAHVLCHRPRTIECMGRRREPCYILRACGHCITNPEQRDQAISFLDYVKGAVGYDTQGIVDMLQSRWTTMDRFIE